MGRNDHDWGIADTVTWAKGRHVFKFGGEYKPQNRFIGKIPEDTYGNFAFNGSFSGNAYSDFLLGIPFTSARLDPLTNRILKDSELGLFLTDSFKVSSRLTLDLGLRWDRFGSPYLRRQPDAELGPGHRQRDHSRGNREPRQPALPHEHQDRDR